MAVQWVRRYESVLPRAMKKGCLMEGSARPSGKSVGNKASTNVSVMHNKLPRDSMLEPEAASTASCDNHHYVAIIIQYSLQEASASVQSVLALTVSANIIGPYVCFIAYCVLLLLLFLLLSTESSWPGGHD